MIMMVIIICSTIWLPQLLALGKFNCSSLLARKKLVVFAAAAAEMIKVLRSKPLLRLLLAASRAQSCNFLDTVSLSRAPAQSNVSREFAP